MANRIAYIIRKEVRQAFREPRMRAMLFVPPMIQLLVFGYAVNLDVENAKMAWMDQDRTPQSRDLLSRFQGSTRFSVTAAPETDDQVTSLLDSGKVDVVVRVLPNFGRDVLRGRTAEVQLLVNGSNSNTASLVASYASGVVTGYARDAMNDESRVKLVSRTVNGPVHPAIPTLNLRSRVWFNPDLRSRVYFVPGVVVNIIALVTLMLTAMAIVREKEIGTMEQLMVTPIKPIELMIGKTLPFAAVGLIDMVMIVIVARLIFHVPFRGSGLLLLFASVCFLLTSLGAGLFISTVSRTQQQAMMTTFLFFQPCFLLSGFAFPIRNMPVAVQYLTLLNPVRYFMEIVRGLFLKGSGIAILWPQMLALTVIGIVVITSSAARFHKRLE
ncbi:MAG TPA: ABC transporter permease [Candidatus Acidoferrum sp.]|nr:ABC transporter permease [Candidatus Acidoferrum sp.]